MASTDLGTKGALETHIFGIAPTAATETIQLSPGTQIYGCAIVITSATGRAPTWTYTQSTGVLTVGAVANADTGFVVVTHE